YEAIANEKRTDAPKYKLGNIIILNIENYTTERPTVKLLPRFEGPFYIIKADSCLLELLLLTNIRVIYIINILKVKFYIEGLLG
ncbi:hypothetical protein NEUTE2DRAFT_60367, partial [Neurospora tetrasperma FGSC 2509]